MAEDLPTVPQPPDDRANVERMVAACIEALERGDRDPTTRVCAERPDLLPRVRRRLAQLAQRGLIPGPEELPTSVGPYRIQRELGSGGMGSVYLAQQTEPVQRDVALKVVKLGMDTREVVARFQAERQALALMNHPNVAQVFDAGITAEGRPYFVMEYVQGEVLTTFCDQRQLAVDARVRLMATICRAVQHAHDRGFIHRDLKPGNVLVTELEGVFTPKIIDFGIAKATAGTEAQTRVAGMQTRADQVLGTPEYMSPEQMRTGGLEVDTRSDVYSLGVTLYELLCGELPFDSRRLRSAGRAELERILLDEPPTQPSKRLSTVDGESIAARGGQRTQVARRIAGELDWITLRALAKTPQERYPSALALAEDLERWLAHEPVLAAPPGAGYRLRKFVRRHRVAVAAGCAVFASLVTGLAISLQATAAARAARERMADYYALARDTVGGLVDVADRELAEVPQADGVRRRMLDDALRHYEALRAREAADPALRADLLDATVRIGTLQRRLGRSADSLRTLEGTVADAEALLVAAGERDLRALQLVCAAHNQLATTFTSVGRPEASRAASQRALDVIERTRALPGVSPGAVDLQVARLCANLAIEWEYDTTQALAFHERALAALQRSQRTGDEIAVEHARMTAGYAVALTRANRLEDAKKSLRAAEARLQTVGAAATAKAREAKAQVQDALADVARRLGDRDQAIAALRAAIDLHHALAEEHPDLPAHADDEAGDWHTLAQLHEDAADLPAAIAAAQRAIAIREALAAKPQQNHRFGMRCVRSLLLLGDLQLQAWQKLGGDREAALLPFTRATQAADALRAAHPDDVDVAVTAAGAHGAFGAYFTAAERFADGIREHAAARDAMDAALMRFPDVADVHYQRAMAANNLLQAHYLNGDTKAAIAAGEAGLPHLARGLQLDARHRALLDLAPTLHTRLAMMRLQGGDFDGGVAALFAMRERPELGADGKEQAALLLMNVLGNAESHPRHDEWRLATIEHLRAAITARGDVAAALQRPAQASGFSHTGSRLRDLDLRLALGDLLGQVEQRDEQRRWLAEIEAIVASQPELSPDRRRNVCAQQCEAALAAKDADLVLATLEGFVARAGDRSGGNYMVASLYAAARPLLAAGERRDRIDTEIVHRLQLSFDQNEVPREAARSRAFVFLRERADFQALLAQ